mmetsp:Transcript_12137/g.48880  ORF Transcript_12137/g.48880 Transcript_12137/m.48880 type:complete len:306 (+) Transcript_12137:168-1085(+)
MSLAFSRLKRSISRMTRAETCSKASRADATSAWAFSTARSASAARSSLPGWPWSLAASAFLCSRSTHASARACLCLARAASAALTAPRTRIESYMGSSKWAVSLATSSVTSSDSWSDAWPSLVSAAASGSVSIWPRSVKARPNSKRPFASSRLRFMRPEVCLATLPIWTSRLVMYATTSSIFSSAGDFSTDRSPELPLIVTVIEVMASSNHDEIPDRPPPPFDALACSASCLACALRSALAAARPASSACRKSLKNRDSLSSSCTASRARNFSSSRRRDSTNSAEKRPTTAFSGSGGTIDPGTSR